MLYEFRFNIILRVVILLGIVAAFVLSFQKGFYLTTGFVGVLLAVAVVNLIYYVNQTNRDLANFFASIQYDDFTTTSSAGHKGKTFGELYRQFNFIIYYSQFWKYIQWRSHLCKSDQRLRQ